MVKILWFSDNPACQASGFANESLQICKGLKAAGHQVIYIGCHSLYPPMNILEFEGIKIYSVPQTGNKSVIQSILMKEKPDLFFTFWDIRKLEEIVAIDRFLKCPWLLFYLLDDAPLPWMYFRTYQLPQMTIIPGSQFLYNLFKDAEIPTADCIELGTDTKQFYPLPAEEKRQLRKKVLGGERYNKTIFGYVGRNQYRKNIPALMEAFCQLPNDVRKASILLLHTSLNPVEVTESGESAIGFDLPNLRKFLYPHENIVFSESDNDISTEMNLIYNLFDYGISATFQEGWGKCTTEGMSAGVPMIINNVSTSEEICGKDWPFLVRNSVKNLAPGINIGVSLPDIKHMTELMEKAFRLGVDKPKEYKELCKGVRNRVLQKFTVENTVGKFLKLIEGMESKGETGWKDSYLFEEILV